MVGTRKNNYGPAPSPAKRASRSAEPVETSDAESTPRDASNHATQSLLIGRVTTMAQSGRAKTSAYGSPPPRPASLFKRAAFITKKPADGSVPNSFLHEDGFEATATPALANQTGARRTQQSVQAKVPSWLATTTNDIAEEEEPSEHNNGSAAAPTYHPNPNKPRLVERQQLNSIQRFFDGLPNAEQISRFLLLTSGSVLIIMLITYWIIIPLAGALPGWVAYLFRGKGIVNSAVTPTSNLTQCATLIQAAEAQVERQFEYYHRYQHQLDEKLQRLKEEVKQCIRGTDMVEAFTHVDKIIDKIGDEWQADLQNFDARFNRTDQEMKLIHREVEAFKRSIEQLQYSVHTFSKPVQQFDENLWSPKLGSTVDPRYTSPTFDRQLNWFRAVLSKTLYLSAASHFPPIEALTPSHESGDCWCAKTDENGYAAIGITTPGLVVPAYWGIEHLPSIYPRNRGLAPKTIELWVLTDVTRPLDEYPDIGCDYGNVPRKGAHCVAKEELAPEAHKASWSLAIPNMDLESGFRRAVVRVTANRGGSPATCIYRLILGGDVVGDTDF